MKTVSLLKDWKVREERLSVTPDMASLVAAKTEDWMEVASLPCDVHEPLIAAGKIQEPTVADNSFASEWIEKRSFWFKKAFTLQKEDLSPFGVELFVEILDIHADLFLNGVHIGHHNSAFYPFRKNVYPYLKEGENELLIRLSVGLEYAQCESFEVIRDFVACEHRYRRAGRGDERRAMLRKPQYVFGWDQSIRCGTCAIAGDVRLDVLDEIVIRDIRFETLAITEEGAKILAEVEVDSRSRNHARDCDVTFTLEKDGKTVYTAAQNYMSQTGVNFRDFSFTLKDPELWWPNGYGEQPLYTVKVTAKNHLGAKDEKSIVTGIRTIELDTSLVGEDERTYTFRVNGKPIYCRGMDFIHSDALYARITREQQDKLLRAAKDANFCMLRFWDGNTYQTDDVYELCDRYGLMAVQNFCFACSAYPDHDEDFLRDVEKEARYQIRRLRNHPSLAIWYGNGESLSILTEYNGTPAIPGSARRFLDEHERALYNGGSYLVGEFLPRIHHELSATVPYQCTTPFGGYDGHTSEKRGSTHYYPFLNLRPEYQQTRISVESFDPLVTHFVAESGVMGPPSAEALARYCGGAEHYDADDAVFEHHRNTFERYAVRDGIYKHYTGEKKLSLEEYCLYGGLFQGMMLEYAADHIRTLPNCGGSLLWCMNDSFGEVGFSLMDHDGNPKPAYYFLRRAYNANRIVLRPRDGKLRVLVSNSAPVPRKMEITCGYVTFAGAYGKTQTFSAELPAFAPMTEIGTFPLSGLDLTHGIVYARVEGEEALTTTYRSGVFRTLSLPRRANLILSDVARTEEELSFTVTTDVYAHGVHFGLPADAMLSDQYFNMLPGESRRITLKHPGEITAADLSPACIFVE